MSNFFVPVLFILSSLTSSSHASMAAIKTEPITQLESGVSATRMDFKIRETKIDIQDNLTVQIPPRLFHVWKSLRETLNFEVGCGLDFNFYRELERVKLTYGKSKTVSYVPDFEVAWHTHPGVDKIGNLKLFSPPSPSDVKIAIQANYNHWLLVSNRLKSDFSNVIVMTAYSQTATRPMVIELSITMDAKGIYTYRANQAYWAPIWLQGLRHTRQKTLKVRDQLQVEVNDIYPKVKGNTISIAKGREQLLRRFTEIAHIEVQFYPWQQLLEDGLKLKLDVVELLQHERAH